MSTPGRKLPPLSPRTDGTSIKRKRRNAKSNEGDEADNTSGRFSRQQTESRSVLASTITGEDNLGMTTDNDAISTASKSPRRRVKKQPGSAKTNRDSPKRATPDGHVTPRSSKVKSKVPKQNAETIASSRGQKRKVKRKKKGSSKKCVIPSIGLAAELDDLRDDVVMVTEAGDAQTEENHWSAQCALRSVQMDRLFMEREGSFRSQPKGKVLERRAAQAAAIDAMASVREDITPAAHNLTGVALQSHHVFMSFSLFLHGLFAGAALWHAITIYMLSYYGFHILLTTYVTLARPVQSLYYLFFAICTVSVFDRYDVNRPSRRCALRSLALQTGGAACLLYVAGLVVSLAIANYDDKISLHLINTDVWEDSQTMESELRIWRAVNMVRAVLALLGWAAVSISPGEDRLSASLETMEENVIGAPTEQNNEVKLPPYVI